MDGMVWRMASNIQIYKYKDTQIQILNGNWCWASYVASNTQIFQYRNAQIPILITEYIGVGLVAGLVVGQLASAFRRTLFRENFAN